jgi:hypothetical protein
VRLTPFTAIVVDSDLKTVAQAKVDFDADFKTTYHITHGVHHRDSTGEVYAPVAMWVESLDLVLSRLKAAMPVPMSRIRGVSGSGQQHGSVYWNEHAEKVLGNLKAGEDLVGQIKGALANEWSPNWQDQSTQKECDAFDAEFGDREALAEVTGSGAHHVSHPSFPAFWFASLLGAAFVSERKILVRCYEIIRRLTIAALHGTANHAPAPGQPRYVQGLDTHLTHLLLPSLSSPGRHRPFGH